MRTPIAALLLMVSAVLFAQERPRSQPPSFALTHVTVIDATGAPARPDMTVVITGERITSIAESGQARIPHGARVVDATGKFLIPGLWDMHVHALWGGRADTFLPLFIANGVTGVRDMGVGDIDGDLEVLDRVRKEAAQGTRVAPRIVASGPIVDGAKPIWPGSRAVKNATEGRQAVDELQKRGVDFIKVYVGLSRDAYFAIAGEAKARGIAFAGHVPAAITATEASDAGQRSIEHLSGVFLASSAKEAQARARYAAAAVEPNASARARAVLEATSLALNSYSPGKGAAMFARFVKNRTWQCPTLTVLRAPAYLDDTILTGDWRLKYLPAADVESWKPRGVPEAAQPRAEYFAIRKEIFQRQIELVKAMHQAGVELLAGTDTPNPYCFPGFSLHDELALLVEAGLTPMEALQAATRNPAKYLGLLDSLGTVEEHKIADLVLLGADPMEDIGNTRRIDAVVVGGRLISKSELQAMLARVEAAVSGP